MTVATRATPKHATCVRCDQPRIRPKGKWAIEAWLEDAFCSTECAKRFHGVTVAESHEQVLADRAFDQALEEDS